MRRFLPAILALLAAGATPPPAVERTATLLYTHDVQGDIEPCG